MSLKAIRAKNLNLIRHMHGGHKHTVKLLGSLVSNECNLSNLALGKKPISDNLAESIEKKLSLPSGWMSRDNLLFTKQVSPIDYEIIKVISAFSEEAKSGLLNFIKEK